MGYQTADVSVGRYQGILQDIKGYYRYHDIQISRDTKGNQSITCNQTTYTNPFQPNGNGNDSYVQNGTADADISNISYFDGQTHLSQREKYSENEIIQIAMSRATQRFISNVRQGFLTFFALKQTLKACYTFIYFVGIDVLQYYTNNNIPYFHFTQNI
ncbi:Hypothetical_protein [Hexamita inflata]|uniref:Hypothetical_protein n=1 Tax=Hexamita inflata TaxID=28002 RepID=A0AA86TRL8_9EUKA|nr:Hypothetical protein HINF_LOCUS7818 [Hexamita inflata]